MQDRLTKTLKVSGYSMTKPRKFVFDELAKAGPITTASLSQKCQTELDQATVYRTVALFEKLGVVNRIWHGFKSQVELSEIFTPHHHHAVCQNCGESLDIVDPELEKILSKLAKKHGFLSVSHTLELSGYCQDCQKRL